MRKPVKKGMARCRKPGGEGTVPSKALEVGNSGKKAEPGTEIPELSLAKDWNCITRGLQVSVAVGKSQQF